MRRWDKERLKGGVPLAVVSMILESFQTNNKQRRRRPNIKLLIRFSELSTLRAIPGIILAQFLFNREEFEATIESDVVSFFLSIVICGGLSFLLDERSTNEEKGEGEGGLLTKKERKQRKKEKKKMKKNIFTSDEKKKAKEAYLRLRILLHIKKPLQRLLSPLHCKPGFARFEGDGFAVIDDGRGSGIALQGNERREGEDARIFETKGKEQRARERTSPREGGRKKKVRRKEREEPNH